MFGRLAIRLRAFGQLFRFYQAALVNTAFGFGVYAGLLGLGVNLFAAQIVAQILGMTLNYFTYSRHVFNDRRAGKLQFVASYGMNYLVNLALLAGLNLILFSPYVWGLVATLGASLINYFVLKKLIFVRAPVP